MLSACFCRVGRGRRPPAPSGSKHADWGHFRKRTKSHAKLRMPLRSMRSPCKWSAGSNPKGIMATNSNLANSGGYDHYQRHCVRFCPFSESTRCRESFDVFRYRASFWGEAELREPQNELPCPTRSTNHPDEASTHAASSPSSQARLISSLARSRSIATPSPFL